MHVRIKELTEIRRNSLVGFVTVQMPSGTIFHDVGIYSRDGKWWATPASKPQVDRNGVVLRDSAGKIKYSPVVSFGSKQARDRFSECVIGALRQACPEVFEARS